jgi:hypothetical protein
MSENRLSATLQALSHLLVVGTGLVYIFGFIIVSVFDATYGIADFSLFRTRVIGAGLVFVCLLGIPMVATLRMFALFGLSVRSTGILAPRVSPKNQWLATLDVVLFIPFSCVVFALLVSFLFKPGSGWKPMGAALYFLTVAVMAAVAVYSQKHFDQRPFVFVTFSLLASVALLIVLFKFADRSFFWSVIWFSCVSGLTLGTFREARTQELRKTPWERHVLIIVPIIFGLYATTVFPNIRHEYGGGAPVPVILHLAKPLPLFNADSASVSLIDETEQGYYVLRGTDKALFIPRGSVEEVEFLSSEGAAEAGVAKP